MSATITKEIDIELDYDDVREAVKELSNYDRNQLVEDCELGEAIKGEIADNLSDFIDENVSGLNRRQAVLAIDSILDNLASNVPTSDVLNEVLSGLDEDVKDELNADLTSNSDDEITDTQKEFLKIVARYMDGDAMGKVVSKHEEGAELLKGFLQFLSK